MTGSHVRITWHVAYDPTRRKSLVDGYIMPGCEDHDHVVRRAARIARALGFPVTITRGVGAVSPWPNEPCLVITSYVRPGYGADRPGRFARALADAFNQDEVVWTEEHVTLNTTERTPKP